ncbi:MAG TPA: hypothetical protein VMI32_03300 [Candidatus Solibacter sp.]|nr:hypothetical protein [Candidatus Solibacter sp.]
MSSSPKGPPVVYAYITNTNGSTEALRHAERVTPFVLPPLLLLDWVEICAALVRFRLADLCGRG